MLWIRGHSLSPILRLRLLCPWHPSSCQIEFQKIWKLDKDIIPTITDRDFVIATVASPTVIKEPEKPAEGEAGAEGVEGEAPAEGAEATAKDGDSTKKDDKSKEGSEKKSEDKKPAEKKPAEKK